MESLFTAMIVISAAGMLYNIVRCCRQWRSVRRAGVPVPNAAALYTALGLMGAFVCVCAGVCAAERTDGLTAALLLGVSAFTWAAVSVGYRTADLAKSQGEQLGAFYNELKDELADLSRDRLSYFQVNLTRDTVEDRGGADLYDSDRTAGSYTALMERRAEHLLDRPEQPDEYGPFSREGLLRLFESGHTSAAETVFCRRPSGRERFVRMEAALARKPDTGDVFAFLTERDCNNSVVRRTMWEKALGEQYDVVAYLSGGRMGVVISRSEELSGGEGAARHTASGREPSGGEGTARYTASGREPSGGEGTARSGADPVRPVSDDLDYAAYLREQIAPALIGTEKERAEILAALDPRRVETALAYHRSYEVSLSCRSGEQVLHKRFDFFPVNRNVPFYVLLIADTSSIRQEQDEQTKLLLDALDEARQASAAKTTFLSNMSHDIRTPMNAIIGFTNLAKQKLDDTEKIREYLDKIQASSSHLLSLINDVLEMSRIESGKIELEEAPCSLPEILHSLHTIIIGQVEGKQQELTMDAVNVTNENIYCDKLRLNQVLLNLLSNAIKYTPSGGKIAVRIIQSSVISGGYGTYEIHVRDNGIGMTPEFASRVFDAFEREKTSTVSGIQGTGLGMAITKKIVDLMGGSITVRTAPGEGTEFIVRVSFRVVPESQPIRRIPALDGIHALVVDDDFETCDSTTNMLVQMGLRSEWTLFGKEAVLRAKQAIERGDGFGVFLVDWRLPDLDGIETVRKIRKAAGEDVRVLLMTAYDWPIIREEAIEAGVNGFCNKPLFMSELRSALTHVMGSAEEQEALTENSHEEERPAVDFTGRRLLLADDIALNREIAVAILSESGFLVEEAVDGTEAVEMVRTAAPGYYDAVLMDVQMPEMDGYEATKAIRALPDPALSEIPIIAMTANAFDEDKKNALRAGMNGHIAKPIDVEKLMSVLGGLLLGK